MKKLLILLLFPLICMSIALAQETVPSSGGSGGDIQITPTEIVHTPADTGVSLTSVEAVNATLVCITTEESKEMAYLLELLAKTEDDGSEDLEAIKLKISELETEIYSNCVPASGGSGGGQLAPVASSGGGGAGPLSSISSISAQPVLISEVEISSEIEAVEYYKVRMDRIMVSADGTEAKISQLKELQHEIGELIQDLIESRTEIHTSELSTLVKEIKITPTSIEAGDALTGIEGKKVYVTIDNKDLIVVTSAEGLVIKEANLTLYSQELVVSDGKVKYNNQELKVLPSVVAEKTIGNLTKLELLSLGNNTVYSVNSDENRKVLGFIQVNAKVTNTYNVENGELLSEQKPWWYGMSTE